MQMIFVCGMMGVKRHWVFTTEAWVQDLFSQAAKKHYLSQAAISQQISKLEEVGNVYCMQQKKQIKSV